MALAFGRLSSLQNLLLLFVVLSLLQTHEVLTIDLVELLLDVVDDFGDTRDEDELERVHTPVGHLKRFIKSHELGLEGCDRDQHLEELSELFSGRLDGLTAH